LGNGSVVTAEIQLQLLTSILPSLGGEGKEHRKKGTSSYKQIKAWRLNEWIGVHIFPYTPSDLMGREIFQQKSHFTCCPA